jgi:hypothetical protein
MKLWTFGWYFVWHIFRILLILCCNLSSVLGTLNVDNVSDAVSVSVIKCWGWKDLIQLSSLEGPTLDNWTPVIEKMRREFWSKYWKISTERICVIYFALQSKVTGSAASRLKTGVEPTPRTLCLIHTLNIGRRPKLYWHSEESIVIKL